MLGVCNREGRGDNMALAKPPLLWASYGVTGGIQNRQQAKPTLPSP